MAVRAFISITGLGQQTLILKIKLSLRKQFNLFWNLQNILSVNQKGKMTHFNKKKAVEDIKVDTESLEEVDDEILDNDEDNEILDHGFNDKIKVVYLLCIIRVSQF